MRPQTLPFRSGFASRTVFGVPRLPCVWAAFGGPGGAQTEAARRGVEASSPYAEPSSRLTHARAAYQSASAVRKLTRKASALSDIEWPPRGFISTTRAPLVAGRQTVERRARLLQHASVLPALFDADA